MAQGQPALNSAAREVFLAKLHERIFGFATCLRCGEDAEDVAQETMLELTRSYGAIQSPEELIKIANAICFNKARNLRRRRGRWVTVPADDARHSSVEPGPETLAIDRELRERVLKALGRCSDRCKVVFRLDLEEADTETICCELKLKPAALYTLRNRCLAEIRDILREA